MGYFMRYYELIWANFIFGYLICAIMSYFDAIMSYFWASVLKDFLKDFLGVGKKFSLAKEIQI